MKLLNLNQPYASALLQGAKRFETRGWTTDYRGAVLLYASAKRLTKSGKALADKYDIHVAENEYGAIVGAGILSRTEPISACDDFFFRFGIGTKEYDLGDYAGKGRHILIFSHMRRFTTPVPHKSRQGRLIDVPEIYDLLQPDDRRFLKIFVNYEKDLVKAYNRCNIKFRARRPCFFDTVSNSQT